MLKLQTLIEKADDITSFNTQQKHTWCSGCGDYGILHALTRALVLEEIKPSQTMLCFDVGCNGNASDKIGAYTIHGLHGRVLALSSGLAVANPDMETVATAGDGATFSEGINHLVQAIRNDYPVTFILHNNSNYGLTIGQASSTTKHGYMMSGSPDGVSADPLNTLQFVLSLNPSFVARSFSGDIEHMTETIQAGLNHKGFSYIEIMQACPTFNKATPQEWYWDKVIYTKDLTDYNKNDIWDARKAVENLEKDLLVGVIYEKAQLNFLERQVNRNNIDSILVKEVEQYDITSLLSDFI